MIDCMFHRSIIIIIIIIINLYSQPVKNKRRMTPMIKRVTMMRMRILGGFSNYGIIFWHTVCRNCPFMSRKQSASPKKLFLFSNDRFPNRDSEQGISMVTGVSFAFFIFEGGQCINHVGNQGSPTLKIRVLFLNTGYS